MIDSDSETDLMANNPFTSTNISVKGPNTKNISLSFRNNALTSTMNSRNNKWQWSTQSIHDQRSLSNRREMSPMSIRSAHDFPGRSFHNARGMSMQRSVFNGRSASPMSMRSTASNVSAVDIAAAIRNSQFSKSDMRIIQNACHKFMKRHTRKRIEKRHNLNVFLKSARRRSSSERELSDSSLSSDECKSARTSIYKENMSSCRSTRTDISKIKRTLQETNMYKDCSANFKQNSFRSMFSIPPTDNNNHSQSQSLHSSMLPKDRFKCGFLLSSQRFNKPVAAIAIPENLDYIQNNDRNKKQCVRNKTNSVANNLSCMSESDQEEIFSEITVKENGTEPQCKGSLDYENAISILDKNRNKLSPIKRGPIPNKHTKRRNNSLVRSSDDDAGDFSFIKPSLPVRKTTKNGQEKLLATSSQPLIKPVEIEKNFPTNLQQSKKNKELVTTDTHDVLENHSTTSEVSMRPSFMKRKLFSQKLDIGEHRNAGTDDPANSPKTVYSAIQKEKNKTRKLVTTQSCLSRDIHEGNNMLDLIHKILPPDSINATVQTNKTKPDVQDTSENKTDIEDKWGVTSIISTCNNDRMSDTYTDDEILEKENNKKNQNDNTKNANSSKSKLADECKIVIQRMNPDFNNIKGQVSTKNQEETTSNNVDKLECMKLLWLNGFESDLECNETVRNNNKINRIYKNGTNNYTRHLTDLNPIEKRNVTTLETKAAMDYTTASINKFNNTILSLKSHRAPKRKKICQQEETNVTKCETQNQKKKSRPDDTFRSDILSDVPANRDIEANNNINSNSKRKRQTPKKKKQKLASKSAQPKLNTSQEINKVISSKHNDTSSVIRENETKSKPVINKTNTKRTCRTPKQNKPKTHPDKYNNKSQETTASIKKIELPTAVITKNETKSKLNINDNYKSNRSCRTSRQNKQLINEKPDQVKLNHTATKNLRSRHIDLSISSNKENDASCTLINDKGNNKRACPTPKPKDSFKLNDKSKTDKSASNLDDTYRSLRSRKIDLSTSLISEKFHSRRKPVHSKNQSKVFNKNVEVNSRKSDISFSLVPIKKTLAKYKRG